MSENRFRSEVNAIIGKVKSSFLILSNRRDRVNDGCGVMTFETAIEARLAQLKLERIGNLFNRVLKVELQGVTATQVQVSSPKRKGTETDKSTPKNDDKRDTSNNREEDLSPRQSGRRGSSRDDKSRSRDSHKENSTNSRGENGRDRSSSERKTKDRGSSHKRGSDKYNRDSRDRNSNNTSKDDHSRQLNSGNDRAKRKRSHSRDSHRDRDRNRRGSGRESGRDSGRDNGKSSSKRRKGRYHR